MPLDSSIPLQVRAPEVEDPTQAYGRMLSLRNMQAQQQQQQQMAPLLYQQHQAQTQEAQMRAQDMQRQIDKERNIAQIYKSAQDKMDASKAQAPTLGAEAAPAPVEKREAMGPTEAAPEPEPDALDYTPVAGASRASLQPASTLQSATAPATPLASQAVAPFAPQLAPSPTPRTAPPRFEDEFTRQMNAAGYGQDVPKVLQNRAVAQEAQFRTQQMERDQKDQQISEEISPQAGGNPKTFLDLATKAGMSQKGQATVRKSMEDAIDGEIKRQGLLDDVQKKGEAAKTLRSDKIADRTNAFLKRSDEDMKDNWPDFVQQLFNDGLSTPEEHEAALALNGGEFPGRSAVQTILDNHASHQWLKDAATGKLAQARVDEAAARNSRTDAHQGVLERQGAQRIAQGQQRLDQSTAAIKSEHESTMRALDNKVSGDVTALLAGQRPGVPATAADVVDALRDRSKWANDEQINPNRQELIDRFMKRANPEVRLATGEANLDKRAEPEVTELSNWTGTPRGKQWVKDNPTEIFPPASVVMADKEWMNNHHPSKTPVSAPAVPPTGGGRGATTGTPAPVAKPAASATPAQQQHKVGDTVVIKGKRFKITNMLPENKFEADPLDQ